MHRRKLAIVFFMLLTMAFTSARAENTDGRWWNKLQESEKLMYVAGFLDGTDYAGVISIGASLAAMANPKTGKFDSSRAEIIKSISKATSEKLTESLSGVTVGQVVEGLNTTFSDYRNQGILISDCMYVVLFSIKGGSEGEVTRLLEMKRKAAGK